MPRLVRPLLLALAALAVRSGADSRAVGLRVDYQPHPMAVDSARPVLSWQMDDMRIGARQTAYQVLVASSPERLKPGMADRWDSGKIATERSLEIEYSGRPLASRDRCWWTVRLWDADGKPGDWSAPGYWEMALLQPSDWRASWIGMRTPGPTRETLADARWIWYPEGDPHRQAPEGQRYFRLRFDVADRPVRSAVIVCAADDGVTAMVNGREVGSEGGWQSAHVFPITQQIRPGANVVGLLAHNDRGPAGVAASIHIEYGEGAPARIATGPEWKCATAPTSGWTEARFDDAAWKPAMVVAAMGDQPWGIPVAEDGPEGPSPLLRFAFPLRKPVASARVYVTARGSYRLSINGRRVGNDILTPDWTDYRKHIPYQVYDVAKLLRPGANAIGAMLGDGWYASGLGWQLQRWCFGPPPVQLLCQLEITHTDGTRLLILSNGTWKAAPGPIQRSEIYAGETYDAAKEQPGWDRPGFDDGAWGGAEVIGPADAAIQAADTGRSRIRLAGASVEHGQAAIDRPALTVQSSPTIQSTQELRPVSVRQPAPGVYVFDIGQNMVGWARLRVKGAAGTRVRMRFAERLKSDGSIYTENLRKAEDTDTYVLRGGADEVFEPHFTYRGYRYVELTGFPGTPTLRSITGIVFNTAVPVSGRLATSSEMVDRLVRNIDWGQRGNLESVPTDCPQRDERLGWMGDAEIFWPTACYNRDMDSFSHKWTRDVREAQSSEGGYSDVSPRIVDLADGAPGWGDAGVVVPYTAWKQYGDTGIIRENLAAMEAWIHYLDSVNPNHLWLNRRNNDFGDWVPANSDTDKSVIATALYARDARMMGEMCAAIDDTEGAKNYRRLWDQIRDAFNAAYVKPDGTVGNGSQTCYALALGVGLLTGAQTSAAERKLVEDIAKRGNHLSTGFIGTAFLMSALSDYGNTDTAYKLLLNTSYPSWGYMIGKGATTIWERWNGDTGDPGMNSLNHYAFGSVGEWLYSELGGVGQAPGSTGFKHIVIRPRIQGPLTWARAEYDSPYGHIATDWKRSAAGGSLVVTIPANTTADVYVPAFGTVTAPASAQLGRDETGTPVYHVGAGTYRFAW